jgi:hypothetical protein
VRRSPRGVRRELSRAAPPRKPASDTGVFRLGMSSPEEFERAQPKSSVPYTFSPPYCPRTGSPRPLCQDSRIALTNRRSASPIRSGLSS